MAALRATIDMVVWRIPPPAVLRRMEDQRLDQLFVRRVECGRAFRVLEREIDRRDHIKRAARLERERRERARAKARAKRRAERFEYDLWVDHQFRRAEVVCRGGGMLNRLGVEREIDPVSLFSGPAPRAAKYASEELANWWLEAGNERMTLAEWKAATREPEFDPTHPDNELRSDDYATAV